MKDVVLIRNAVNTSKKNVLTVMESFNEKESAVVNKSVRIDTLDPLKDTIVDGLIKDYSRPSVKLIPRGFGIASEKETCFYGYPRFIQDQIPVGENGKQLRFMAQLNCEELTDLPDFPHKGLLQFWVQADKHKMFLDGGKKNYQVIYIEAPDSNNISNVELDISLYQHDDYGDFPYISIKGYNHSDNLLFDTTTEISIPNTSDADMLNKIMKQKFAFYNDDNNKYMDSMIKMVLHDERFKPSWGNRVGGYPSYTQNGPAERALSWDTLLLQLDSSNDINWGDSGIASFYISHDDLKRKDFSNIGFYWDCC